MIKCTVCQTELQPSFSLGELYLSNFIPTDQSSHTYPKSDLTVLMCPTCGTGRLKNTVDTSLLYSKYWYYSGINQTMKTALKNVVDSCMNSIPYENGDVWLDIASNDNTLLSIVPTTFRRIGIDPSNVSKEAFVPRGSVIVNDFFSKEAYNRVYSSKAKFITCIAMFYDLENPHRFLDDVSEILSDDGVFVIQISYTPLMIRQLEFGNVCAEHVMYYSLDGLRQLLSQHGLYVVDCELNDINGGSFRVYCVKSQSKHFKNPQQRDVAYFRVESLIAHERAQDRVADMANFGNRIESLKHKTRNFISQEVAKGKKVYAYGASTKGNTLLQYFGLDNSLIKKVAERNNQKWGLKTIGTNIPVCSEKEMRDDNPDYLLILPWHFIEEFKIREEDFLLKGGKFITPCPEFEIITL